MAIKPGKAIPLLVFLCVICLRTPAATSRETVKSVSVTTEKELTLVHAVMCEDIRKQKAWNEAAVFSVKLGKVACFTSFDPVPEETFIYHNWYCRDKPVARMKLFLHPPRWSTFSRIRTRNADKGPWRVEISDKNGGSIATIRFSITE